MNRPKHIAAIALVPLLFSPAIHAVDAASNADQVIARHLQSLGDTQVLANLHSRMAQGTAEFRLLVGGNPALLDGKFQFVSQGGKLHFLMKLPSTEYRGEQFIFDDRKVEVSASTSSMNRSALGSFVYAQDIILREGLWGGVLSTAWPLLSLGDRNVKLAFDGIKKVDGNQWYEIRYLPKKSSDVEIRLYFDPVTYHHVRTVYSMEIAAGLGEGEIMSARQQQARYNLEERFDDFKTIDGMTLPQQYEIRFSQELRNGSTKLYDWKIQATEILNNLSLDPRNFVVH